MRHQVVAGDVSPRPIDLRHLELRQAPRQAENGIHRRLVDERIEQARADVPGRADDDDPHQALTPSSSTSVKNAFAYGDSLVRSRTSSQSICSRTVRAISSTWS